MELVGFFNRAMTGWGRGSVPGLITEFEQAERGDGERERHGGGQKTHQE